MKDILRDPSVLSARIHATGAAALIDEAVRDGVAGMLAHVSGSADPALTALRRRLMLEEELRVAELQGVVETLGVAGVRAAVLKGSALAYTHYPAPWCRTRVDLDLLVQQADLSRVGQVLRMLGYAADAEVAARGLLPQYLWEREVAPGAHQLIDVHTELTNRVLFAARLPGAACLARAVPAPFAGPRGWQLDAIDALLYSCVHRVAHHSVRRRLVWSDDIARQAEILTPSQVEALTERARSCGIASVCGHELAASRVDWERRAGALDEIVTAELSAAGRDEPAREFLAPGRGVAGDFWLDVRAFPRSRDRLRFVGTHLVPPRAYMLTQPGVTPHNLPWRYIRRLVAGAFKWGS